MRQLTFDDGLDRLDGWSRDGRWLYFSSSGRDIAGMNDIYRVSAEGGTPMAVSADRYTSEFFAAPSPDGQRMAFTARGNSAGQWWRKGHSHLDESEMWLLHEGPNGEYEQLTERGAKQGGRCGRPTARASVRVGSQRRAEYLDGDVRRQPAKQVTRFEDGRVLWPTISHDGRTIVFERDFEIWKMDTGRGRAARVADHASGACRRRRCSST